MGQAVAGLHKKNEIEKWLLILWKEGKILNHALLRYTLWKLNH